MPLKVMVQEAKKKVKEMNGIPKNLWSPCLVLKNPSISFLPHNPN